ncbi:MAG: rhomboid family intramembrane serine protease [Lachnospiraceae bacterium]|nr:rhomboid family intramembrane serine protease [Lachnospiraceae bacterium]
MRETTEIFEAKKGSVNVMIAAVTVVVFFVMQFLEKRSAGGVFYGHTSRFLLEHGALYGPYVKDGEWYRLFTYMFLHMDIGHLVNNMLVLFFLGNALEYYVGKIPYMVLYFCSGILAALGSVVYNINNPVCVGASGAVFGITGAMAWLLVKNRGQLAGMTKQRMFLFVIMSAYGGFVDKSIDNAAHMTGLAAGFLLAMLFYRNPEQAAEEAEGNID